MNDSPGINGTTFIITCDKNSWNKNDVLGTPPAELEVISEPVRRRYQWYWKILWILTLGTFFWEYYVYEVKFKQNDNRN